MKLARELKTVVEGDTIILIEREAYLPRGHSRRKWTEQRVGITKEELRGIAEKHLGGPKGKG